MACLPARWSFRHWQILRHTYLVSLTACSVVAAKLIHIYYHLGTLAFPNVPIWGPTIVLQDVALILLTRALTGENRRRWMTLVGMFISLDVLGMAAVRIAFRLETGSELHWSTFLSFPRDAAGFKLLMTGSSVSLGVIGTIMFIAWLLTPFIYDITGYVVEAIAASLARVIPSTRLRQCLFRGSRNPRRGRSDVERQLRDSSDWDGEERESTSPLLKQEDGSNTGKLDCPVKMNPTPGQWATSSLFAILSVLWLLQPPFPAYVHLSSSLPIIPFNFWGAWDPETGRDLDRMVGIANTMLNPEEAPTPLSTATHPPASEQHPKISNDSGGWQIGGVTDRLHISNLEEDLLDPLQEALSSVNIKHVMLIKLESTRDDVFPLRNDSYVWKRIQEAYDGQVPTDVQEQLANLTSTAEFLTGRPSNLDSAQPTPRGGLTATNAFTACTYTLKSQVASVCGVSPMVVDYNQEWKNHFYQPCLPQIFSKLDQDAAGTRTKTDDFRSWEWESIFMQSVTDSYDHHGELPPRMGFNQSINKETLEDPGATFYPPKTEEVNYYGYADTELREYFRKALKDAEENQRRLFINHITSTTHHPWGVPGFHFDEYMNDLPEDKQRNLNRYINTVGFVDDWLSDMLGILEEFGVAEETLLVYVGDHGLSLPFDGNPTPYNNPHIGNLHVPLVFSHPRLPHVQIDAPVISYQILPTILDLLVSTPSLDDTSAATIKSLRHTYEGQSLIRPQLLRRPAEQGRNQDLAADSLEGDPFERNWQFSVLNPGGSSISIRDASRPYHLAAPLSSGFEWEFYDLSEDPFEEHPLKRLDPVDLLGYVRDHHGDDAVRWIGQASEVASWWWRENWRRWRYEGNGRHRKPT